MTPERAAEVLGVAVDATPTAVEHAFQRRARVTHPDLSPADADAAADDAGPVGDGPGAAFREAAEARRVLLVPRPVAPAPRLIVRDGPRLQGPGLLTVWAGLLVVAAFLSIFAAPYPFTIAEPLIRWAVLITATMAFATSGRRGFMVVAIVAEVATLAMTIAVTTLGGLLALLITLPALLGAFTAGIVRRRFVERARSGG